MTESFLEMVNRSISAGYLVVLIVFLRLVWKKMPKWMAVLLWGFVAFRLLCPVTLESRISLIPSAQVISREIMLSAQPAVQSGISSVDQAVNPALQANFSPDPVASANPLQILLPVLSQLWLLGMVLMAAYTALSYLRLRRRVSMGTKREGNIYQSEAVNSPFILGLFVPRIYLPYRISDQDAAYVIAHEQTHIRRGDHLWKPLGFLLLTLTWFHPLMWGAYILLCRDIELACDEAAVRHMAPLQRAEYSQTLLTLSISRRQIAACPLAFGEIGIKERVKHILSYRKPTFWVVLAGVILCGVIAVTFLTTPSTKGLEMLQCLSEEDIMSIQSISTEQSKGATFYGHDHQNLGRILPILNQAKGTPISRPFGVREQDPYQNIIIFLKYDLWDFGRQYISLQIIADRYLVVENYWYEADPQWLATLPQNRDDHAWRTNLQREDIQSVEFFPEPGYDVQQADIQRLVGFLNRMQIPAIGYPDQLPERQAVYRITTIDGVSRELTILGSKYLMIDDVLYDVSGSLEELTEPPRTLEQLPLPEDPMAIWVRAGYGQPLVLIQDSEILDQILAMLNEGKLQSDADDAIDADIGLVLFWPNGDTLNLFVSKHGSYFKMGEDIYSYGAFNPDAPERNREQLWKLFGFSAPLDEESRLLELTSPLRLPNETFGEVLVMPKDTVAVSGRSWNEGNTRECEHAYMLHFQNSRYHLRMIQNDGGIRTRSYRKMIPAEHDGKQYYVLTNSLLGISGLEEVKDEDYILAPG